MSSRWTDEWLEGYEACEQGETEWSCPYPPGSYDARQWLSGWQSADFDDRAADVLAMMENGYGFQ